MLDRMLGYFPPAVLSLGVGTHGATENSRGKNTNNHYEHVNVDCGADKCSDHGRQSMTGS